MTETEAQGSVQETPSAEVSPYHLFNGTKAKLLRDAARKPVKRFLQIDGETFAPGDMDDVWKPDKDGHGILAGTRFELSSLGMPVRVLVHEGTDKADVVGILRKVLGWVEHGWEHLVCEGWDSAREDWSRPSDSDKASAASPAEGVVIGMNAGASSEACAFCGARTETEAGPALLAFGTQQAICPKCAQQHAPELARLLSLWRAALAATRGPAGFPF